MSKYKLADGTGISVGNGCYTTVQIVGRGLKEGRKKGQQHLTLYTPNDNDSPDEVKEARRAANRLVHLLNLGLAVEQAVYCGTRPVGEEAEAAAVG